MDSDALLTFVAVHRNGGFSAAAQALKRSQPAISRRIALLEEELGMPVFERVTGGVTLSAAGRALLPHAERILATLDDAESAIRSIRVDSGGPVTIATVGTLAGSNLSAVLKRFASACPRAELSIRTATSAEVSELVRRGEATIGLRYLEDASPDLVCEQVAAEKMRIACAVEHPLAGRKIRSLVRLKDECWLAFPSAEEYRETFADNVFSQFQARGVATVRWSPVDSLTAQKRLIEAGFGMALLPETAIQEELEAGALATIDVSDLHAAHPVCCVVRKGGFLTPAAQRLLALLKDSGNAMTRPRRRKARKTRR